jgi:hypothetical protein
VHAAPGNAWDYEQVAFEPNQPAAPAPESPMQSLSANPSGNCACSSLCCDPQVSVYALVEGTFFWPQFHRNFMTSSYVNPNTIAPVNIATNSALGSTDGSFLAAPRITLGVQGERWGILARYWNANSWATGFTPANPGGTAPGITNFDGFKAYTADIELQRRGSIGAWNLYGFGGGRYASVNNDRNLNVSTFGGLPAGAGDTITSSFASQQFNGTGVTFGFWGTRTLGCSPFKLFVSNRYSYLWGTGSAASQTSAEAGLLAAATNGAGASSPGNLFIGEVQAGLQWDAQLQCFPGRAFIRTGIEYQYWDANTGVATASNSFAGAVFAGSTSTASAGDLLFSLVGFNIGAGILY